MKLNMRRKYKKRLPVRNPQPLSVPESMNQSWSIDFMSDSLWDGRRFRTFNVIDDYNREALAIEVDLNLPAQRVIRVLDRLVAWRGFPQQLRINQDTVNPTPTIKSVNEATASLSRFFIISKVKTKNELTLASTIGSCSSVVSEEDVEKTEKKFQNQWFGK
jgi:hypothetical protein